MLKLSENPPILPPHAETPADLSGKWWVGHTKSRFEKVFAKELLGHGIGYFLPLIEKVRVSSGKKRRMMMPLFPGYVFFCGTDIDRHTAMTTNRLCQTIDVPDQEGLVDQLVTIGIGLSGKAQLDPYPFAAIGSRCRIMGGPFQGMEGIVIYRNSISRIVLEISILGQGAVMEIDTSLLEPVE